MRVRLSKRSNNNRRQSSGGVTSCNDGSGEDDGEAPFTLGSLPDDALYNILQHLEPLSLAALACTNKQMRDMTLGAHMVWSSWSAAIFSTAAGTRPVEHVHGHLDFCNKAMGRLNHQFAR